MPVSEEDQLGRFFCCAMCMSIPLPLIILSAILSVNSATAEAEHPSVYLNALWLWIPPPIETAYRFLIFKQNQEGPVQSDIESRNDDGQVNGGDGNYITFLFFHHLVSVLLLTTGYANCMLYATDPDNWSIDKPKYASSLFVPICFFALKVRMSYMPISHRRSAALSNG